MRKIFFKILFVILIFASIVACNLNSSGSLSKNWQVEKSFKNLQGIGNENDAANIQIGFLNSRIGFAINKGNHVYYTNNSGDSWNETVVKTPPCLTGMELIDENNIVIGCRCSKVKFSNDNGINWETIDENNFTLFSFYDKSSGIIAKSDVVNVVKMMENNNIREIVLPDEFKNTAIAAVSRK
jgi:hypothetical protein